MNEVKLSVKRQGVGYWLRIKLPNNLGTVMRFGKTKKQALSHYDDVIAKVNSGYYGSMK